MRNCQKYVTCTCSIKNILYMLQQRVKNHTKICLTPTTFSVQKCATKPRCTDSQNILAFYDSKFSCQSNASKTMVKSMSTRFLCNYVVSGPPRTNDRCFPSSHFCGWAAVCIPCLIQIIKLKKYKTYISMIFKHCNVGCTQSMECGLLIEN